MNRDFVDAVRAAYRAIGNKPQFPEVQGIRQMRAWKPKGFTRPVACYAYQA